jgi:hypothetical protein
MIMNMIADAIDGNVGSKTDRSIAINHSSIRSCLHFVGIAEVMTRWADSARSVSTPPLITKIVFLLLDRMASVLSR